MDGAVGGTLSGSFPYGKTATLSATGRVRKERFSPKAFRFAVEEETEREINLLVGHDFGKPLASRRGGTLVLQDRADALSFEAELPPESEQPSWMADFLLAHRAGLVGGLSPGFVVPPSAVVPNAESLVPEPGNPGVMIRDIADALLIEMSGVTRPAYGDTEIVERSEDLDTGPYWHTNPEALRWL